MSPPSPEAEPGTSALMDEETEVMFGLKFQTSQHRAAVSRKLLEGIWTFTCKQNTQSDVSAAVFFNMQTAF